MKKKISNRTIALIAAAVVLFASGGVMGTRAALSAFSDPYNAEFALDHLGVTITENGESVAESGMLAGVKLHPGEVIKDEVAARNTTEIDQFARIIVTKYWLDENGNKDFTKDPALIKLIGGKGWTLNKAESTRERSVYYYNKVLKGGSPSTNVFDAFKVDGKVLTMEKDGKLAYDGNSVFINAEVQVVQTHNATDAIRSAWGVQNVSADEQAGTLTVSN